jgi:predicted DNA-binding protein (MmcQ/YjbR family)
MLQHSEVSEKLRAICLSLPGVVEQNGPGQITFQVGQRPFVVIETFRDTEGKSFRCLAFKASFFDHEQLSSDPQFFPAPYLGGAGWLGCRLDVGEMSDIATLSTVLERSHRQIAGRMVSSDATPLERRLTGSNS